jgi:hypothetical protein
VSAEHERIERLILLAERLTAAVLADIAALKSGKPQEMRTPDPEIQRMSAVFGREATGFDIARAGTAPPELRRKFLTATKEFRDALAMHARMLTRVRSATEGIIKAVAEEVERRRAPTRTYAPVTRRAGPGAMVYNAVV